MNSLFFSLLDLSNAGDVVPKDWARTYGPEETLGFNSFENHLKLIFCPISLFSPLLSTLTVS